MKDNVKQLWPIILGLCAVVCVLIASFTLYHIKTITYGGISVTGSASKDFDADLIVWRGYYSEAAVTQKEAYEKIKNDQEQIRTYLSNNDVNGEEIVFSSVDIRENYAEERREDPKTGQVVYSTVFSGYTLTQNVTITSGEVDKIEAVSRDITDLINTGIAFMSAPPEYYYTRLSDLKIEMIAEATENAKLRATMIAENSGSSLGKLKDANLGVFQITARNSSEDSFSSSGAFNISSKQKTAQITVKLFYGAGDMKK